VRLADLDRIARRQHGVVERSQTAMSTSAWHRATADGRLIAVHRRVARLPGTAETAQQQMMAAILAAGPGALVSHRSAAFLHGMAPRRPPVVDLVVPTSRSRRPTPRTAFVRGLDGVVAHRPSDRGRPAPHRIDGIACTNVLRTLLDLGAVAPDLVLGAVGHALTDGLATLDAIATCLLEHGRPGRAGVGPLRRALDEWTIDAKPADSVLEPAMHRLVALYGLPPVEFHPMVGGREVDFRVVGTPIVIECDGWRHHGREREQFERDRDNDAEFSARGWIVLRFTYRAITSRPGRVAGQIRAAIERWAGVASPDAA
jgi:very-short-patch-repair endonuclease